MNPGVPRPIVEQFARERVRNPQMIPFCLSLYDGAIAHRREIDSKLTLAAENWRLVRMAAVDRNVLRLGAYQLLFPATETPAPVAIDEAIELGTALRFEGLAVVCKRSSRSDQQGCR